jgi:hypothetical protein
VHGAFGFATTSILQIRISLVNEQIISTPKNFAQIGAGAADQGTQILESTHFLTKIERFKRHYLRRKIAFFLRRSG